MDPAPRKLVMEYTGERMVPEGADPRTFWEHIHRYRFAAKRVRGKRVLDIACGEGYGSFGLLSAGAKSVTGVDIDERTCAHAASRYGIEARVGSAEDIPLDTASVDVVVSFETIEHVPNPNRFVQEISRVLTPGGLLIISTPDRDFYRFVGGQNPYHCSEMTKKEFQTLLGSVFPKVQLFGQYPYLARWWSPVSLVPEHSSWDRLPKMRRFRERAWAKWDPQRATPVPEADRENPVKLILGERASWLERAFSLSAVRPLRLPNCWRPVYLVAVARKVN